MVREDIVADEQSKLVLEVEGATTKVRFIDKVTGSACTRTVSTPFMIDTIARRYEPPKVIVSPLFEVVGSNYSSVRYFQEYEKGLLVVVTETSPMLTSLCISKHLSSQLKEDMSDDTLWKDSSVTATHRLFPIHWPYLLMFHTFRQEGRKDEWRAHQSSVAWADKSFTQLSDPTYTFTLPNTYGPPDRVRRPGSSEICWGHTLHNHQNIPTACAKLSGLFLSSEFNTDLAEPGWYFKVLPALSPKSSFMNAYKDSVNPGRITLPILQALASKLDDSSVLSIRISTVGEALNSIQGD